jgi:hypothetical protein
VSTDLSTAAGSIVLGTPGAHGCLVLSADGLPLAIHPAPAEGPLTATWSRVASLGPVRRGFVAMGSEVWAFVQTEQHGVLVLADAAVRAGRLLDAADKILSIAASHQERASRKPGGLERRPWGEAGGAREGRERGASGRRFRMPLHRDPPLARPLRAPEALTPQPEPPRSALPGSGGSAELSEESVPPLPAARSAARGADPSRHIDIAALAREFAALLADREDR